MGPTEANLGTMDMGIPLVEAFVATPNMLGVAAGPSPEGWTKLDPVPKDAAEPAIWTAEVAKERLPLYKLTPAALIGSPSRASEARPDIIGPEEW